MPDGRLTHTTQNTAKGTEDLFPTGAFDAANRDRLNTNTFQNHTSVPLLLLALSPFLQRYKHIHDGMWAVTYALIDSFMHHPNWAGDAPRSSPPPPVTAPAEQPPPQAPASFQAYINNNNKY